MANLTKIFGLAGAVAVFTGLAYGQATCAAPTTTTNIIRAEGTTEQVAAVTFVCTAPAGGATAGTATVQVFISPSLPVTSKVLSSSSGATEALLQVNGTAPGTNAAGAAGSVQGTVSGSTINFSGVQLPALAAAATYTFTISNVRVNATSLTVGSGVPPTVSETIFVSGSSGSLVPAALSSVQVSFAENGLGSSSIFKSFNTDNSTPVPAQTFPTGTGSSGGTNNFVICNSYSPANDKVNFTTANAAGGLSAGKSLAFVVRVAENFATAFKEAGTFNGNGAAPTAVDGNGPIALEQSQVGVTAPASNAVVEGTRFAINFSNVPSAVTLYVPNGAITSTNGSAAMAQLTASAPGTAFAAVAGSASSSITSNTGFASGGANTLAAVTISSGAGSAVFEITKADPNNLDRFDIPVFAVTSSNGVAGSSTAITASVSFNPVGSTVIPNFAVTSSSNTVTGSTFNLCTTSLLFPFVTNQIGFDTGLAIANTSTDPFGSAGATAQAGTCTLNFYGSGAPSPSNVVTPNVPSGTVYTATVSSVAAGFQGYLIAQCAFQYAHGFAFITDGVGTSGGLSEGYLAGVIPDVNQTSRGANPLSVAAAGTGETLGN